MNNLQDKIVSRNIMKSMGMLQKAEENVGVEQQPAATQPSTVLQDASPQVDSYMEPEIVATTPNGVNITQEHFDAPLNTRYTKNEQGEEIFRDPKDVLEDHDPELFSHKDDASDIATWAQDKANGFHQSIINNYKESEKDRRGLISPLSQETLSGFNDAYSQFKNQKKELDAREKTRTKQREELEEHQKNHRRLSNTAVNWVLNHLSFDRLPEEEQNRIRKQHINRKAEEKKQREAPVLNQWQQESEENLFMSLSHGLVSGFGILIKG